MSITTVLSEQAALPDQVAARRLVERLGLGPRPGEVQTAVSTGFEATLTALTRPPGRPDPGVVATPPPTFPATGPRLGKDAPVEARRAQRRTLAAQARQLGIWWLDRMVAVEDAYPERMTWFWHGHFATSVQKVEYAHLMYTQNDTLRRLGRGDFHSLAQAMIVDPAMLVWLDGSGSKVDNPNENLAREFMELFSLGVGNYSETDVRQAARALTGWRVNRATDTVGFVPRAHDNGPESLLGTSERYDAPALVDLLLRQPASPRFLGQRVWTRFVSDTPPDAATLDRLVGAYGANRDITALVTEAVRSPAFRDPASVLVKEPVLWLVGALRVARLPASKLPTPVLNAALVGLGQVPFTPPSVGGWPAGAAWLTTAAALTRLRTSQAIARAGDITPVTATAPSGRVDATAALLGLPGFTDRTRAALRPLVNQPDQLVGLALTSPEYTVSA